MKSENKNTNLESYRKEIVSFQMWGLVGEMCEGGQKVDTSSYKINAMGMCKKGKNNSFPA